MALQHVFVISRAGSLIYDLSLETAPPDIERKFEFPLPLALENVNKRAVVTWGSSKDGVPTHYYITAVNGCAVDDATFMRMGTVLDVFEFLEDEKNFPVELTLSPSLMTTNEKIVLSSTFQTLFAIAVQLSPRPRSSGITALETPAFHLYCLQPRTGVKFVAVAAAGASEASMAMFLKKLYEIYADYALKDPFYAFDMPIRCAKFVESVRALVDSLSRPNAMNV